jgi:carboxyl-terminal processing protease
MSEQPRVNIPVRKDRKNALGGLGISLALLLAIGTFASGVQVGSGNDGRNYTAGLYNFLFTSAEPEPSGRPDLTEFWSVWDLLEENYVSASSSRVISVAERIEGAIDGLVDVYDDPYTVYLPPVDATLFEEDVSGEFSGVGMEVGLRDGLITIIAPLPDTPAAAAGLLAGDVIIRIDDVSTEDMRIDEAVRLIRGEKGSTVDLTIFRDGASEFQTITVTRDTIEIPTVRTNTEDGVFVITLFSFNALSEQKMREAVAEFLASDSDKLIVDLRGNPGGYLQSAVSIASFFLPSGKVVVTQESGVDREETVFRSRSRVQTTMFSPEKLVVLVDGGSASASEILAGALKDHEVATVLGSQTFGKGSVQELIDLDDGSSLKVTVARWLTPAGTSISDGGLAPNIVISRTTQQILAGEDPQLEAAIAFLNGEEVVSEDFEEQFTAKTDVESDTGEPEAGEAR